MQFLKAVILVLTPLSQLAFAADIFSSSLADADTAAFMEGMMDLFPPPIVTDTKLESAETKLQARDLLGTKPSEITAKLMARGKKCDPNSACAPMCNGTGPWMGRPSSQACVFCIAVYMLNGSNNGC